MPGNLNGSTLVVPSFAAQFGSGRPSKSGALDTCRRRFASGSGFSSRLLPRWRSRRIALVRGETINAAWLLTAASVHLRHRVPLLQQADRGQGLRARREPGDAGRPARRRPRLRADESMDRLRPPLRGHRRPGPARRTDARRAVRLPARRHLDHRRRGARRRGAGLRHPRVVGSAQRQVARPDGARGDRTGRRRHGAGRRARHHDRAARRARARRRQRAQVEPLGHSSRSGSRSRSRC